MELGLQWIEETFGVKPSVLWQLDPFGHSGNTPSLFKEQFEYAIVNRISDDVKDNLIESSDVIFNWNEALIT